MPHIKIYFSSRAQAIVKGTQCERHSLRSRDPHGEFPKKNLACQRSQVGDRARSISSSRARTTGTNWTSVSQKSEGGRHEEDHQVCLIQIRFIHPDLQLFRVFRKLLDGKTHNPIDETAVDEFQQGVDDLIDIAVINTATLVQGGSV
jgi:hypothetical protein